MLGPDRLRLTLVPRELVDQQPAGMDDVPPQRGGGAVLVSLGYRLGDGPVLDVDI